MPYVFMIFLNSEGDFLFLDEVQKSLNLSFFFFFLQYLQLLSAIPTDLKKESFESSNTVLRHDSKNLRGRRFWSHELTLQQLL